MSPFTILKRIWISLTIAAVMLATVSSAAAAASTAPYWPAYTQTNTGNMARDHVGNVYLTYTGQNYLQQIKADGTLGMQWGGLNNPSAMVEAKDFSGILVSTSSGLRKLGFDGAVTALNAQTDLGYLHYAPDGTLFSTSYGNSMVYQISDTWQVSAYLPSGTISMPSSFTFNDDGELIISSNATRSIYRVKKDKSVQQVLSVASAGMSGNPNMVMRYYGQGWLVSTSTAMYILNDQWQLQSKLVDNYADNLVTLNDGTMIFVKGNTSGIFQLIGAPAGSTLPPVNQPPSVTLVNPANGQQFTSPANLTLNATATDSDGTVAQVAFFNGTTLLGTVTQAPYTVTIPNLVAGSYSIKAVATDNLGATGSSNLASIVVDSPPAVTLVASPNTATAPAVLALTANTSDTDGSIAKVEFFNGATSLGVVTQAPFSFNWTNVAAGTYTLTVKATDNLGVGTISSAVTVVVSASSGTGTGGPEQVYYIQADHLNTPRILTNKDNGIVWQWGQDEPFGATVASQDPGNSGKQTEFNLRFPGQYFDKETNTHYNYFRDYDPSTGRYIQSDPIGLDGGINTYGYVGGNPTSGVDPEGLQVFYAPGRKPSPGPGWGYSVPNGPMPIVPDDGDYSRSRDRESRSRDREKPKDCPANNGGPDCDQLNRNVQAAKDAAGGLGACKAGMSRWDLEQRYAAWVRLALARAIRDEKCWGGGDEGHQKQQADNWKTAGTCGGYLGK